MPSSACYTNKLRVNAEAQNTKVEYPRKIGLNNNPILSARNCSPNFSVLTYTISKCNLKRCSKQE